MVEKKVGGMRKNCVFEVLINKTLVFCAFFCNSTIISHSTDLYKKIMTYMWYGWKYILVTSHFFLVWLNLINFREIYGIFCEDCLKATLRFVVNEHLVFPYLYKVTTPKILVCFINTKWVSINMFIFFISYLHWNLWPKNPICCPTFKT